jgi:hypothetical protein
MAQEAPHIALSRLWEHSQNQESLIAEELDHLATCQDCVAIVWVCRSLSWDDAKRMLESEDQE